MSVDQKIEVQSLKDRCRQTQMRVYDRLYPKVYLSVHYIKGNKIDAEDIAQEAFLKAFKRIDELNNPEPLDSWIRSIARNKALEQKRKKSSVSLDGNLAFEAETEIEEQWQRYDVQEVLQAMVHLPDGYRPVMTLYLLDDMNQEQIAEAMGISSSASRSQYSRAKKKLIHLLKRK